MNDIVPFTIRDAASWITAPTGNTDKYARGVLGIATGSAAYPGAAVMGVDAAVHTGVGMVRYVGPSRAADLVLARRPEIVAGVGRVQAWLVGSGTNSSALDAETSEGLRQASSDGVPVVVDAGALGLVDLGANAVLTPHAGEVAKLLGIDRSDVGDDPLGTALRAAERTGSTVLLKGEVTHVVSPDGSVRFSCSVATPWLAAAGAGDVLGGVLGALVATRAARGPLAPTDLAHLAAAAAVIHGRAAQRVSRGGPFTMLALIEELSVVVGELVVGGVA